VKKGILFICGIVCVCLLIYRVLVYLSSRMEELSAEELAELNRRAHAPMKAVYTTDRVERDLFGEEDDDDS
jgi:hypothetical protein